MNLLINLLVDGEYTGKTELYTVEPRKSPIFFLSLLPRSGGAGGGADKDYH